MSKSNRVYALVPNTPTQSTATPPAPNWQTGICDCAGENQCCLQCCLVTFGLDFCLFKDTQEWYMERQHGLSHDNSRAVMPDSLLEECIGNTNYRGLGVLCTCGLAALTGGVFDLLWCCLLARQRGQVRDMYHIGGDPCSDCFLACCCRCCMFNQLKHQLEVDNPNPPSITPEQVNTMRAEKESYRNKTLTVSNKTFNNPPKEVRSYSTKPPFVKYQTPPGREYL